MNQLLLFKCNFIKSKEYSIMQLLSFMQILLLVVESLILGYQAFFGSSCIWQFLSNFSLDFIYISPCI